MIHLLDTCRWDDGMTEGLDAVLTTDFASEYITDYFTGEALQYLV